MSRVWFASELETAASFWRIFRRDGVTLGFTSHDRDLRFDGVLHRSAPGMVPSAIRRTADFEPDSAEVTGALSHDAISSADLAAGRFDGAQVIAGLVDWESLDSHVVYGGKIGSVSEEAGHFSARLLSRKEDLRRDPVPRTGPTCRAEFCGPGCQLSAAAFTHLAQLSGFDLVSNGVMLNAAADPGSLVGGVARWLDGPHAGLAMGIAADSNGLLALDMPLDANLTVGLHLLVREGCDRTLPTCSGRFANAINFQGEPFVPGNDLLTRYPDAVK